MKTLRFPGKTLPFLLRYGFLFAGLAWCSVYGYQRSNSTRAWLSYLQRDYAPALEEYRRADDPSGIALCLIAQHRPAEAFALYQSAGDNSGMGLACLENREYAKAIQYFEKGGDHRGKALALLALNQPQEAAGLFDSAGDFDGIGLCWLQRGNSGEARLAFGKSGNRAGFALSFLMDRDYAAAEQEFAAVKDSAGLALVAMARRDYTRAEALALEAADFSLAGGARMLANDFPQAEAWFKKANDLAGLGDLYARFDNWSAARAAFDEANQPVKVLQCFRRDNFDPNATALGLQYVKDTLAGGDFPPEFLLEAADHYFDCGFVREAEDCLAVASGHAGLAHRAALRRGRLQYRLGRTEEALASFRSVDASALAGAEERRAAAECISTATRHPAMH